MPTEVAAEIAGNVWKIETRVGAEVEAEEVLLILESMKMELHIASPRAGQVDVVHVVSGERVAKGQQLLTLVEGVADGPRDTIFL